MHGQSWDELERITKIRRIKNYEEMSKEELIISLLKSKQSIVELFINDLDDNKISDIWRILNRLRDILPKGLPWSTISALNYNKIMKKEFEKTFEKN